MTLVILAHLKLGQTFPESSLVKLRITEEANHWGIYFSVHKSNEMRLKCKGKGSFFVHASNLDIGWSITKCEVLVEQGDQPVPGFTTSTTLSRLPYKVSYIIPLITKTIAETPMASNKVVHQILEPYGRAYCFADAIIQGAKTEARKLIFGDIDNNIAYTHFVKEDLEKAGRHVELSFTTRKETMKNLDITILAMDGILPADRKYLFFSGGRNTSPKFTNDWGLQQINSVLSFSTVYSLHPHLQKQLSLIYRKFSWLAHAI